MFFVNYGSEFKGGVKYEMN